jgi:hypothetical protein
MIGYKGFNAKLQGYNNFQFEEGKTYEITGNLEMCKNGFHFCDMPLNVVNITERMIYLLLKVQMEVNIGINMINFIERMIYLLLKVQMEVNIGINNGKYHRENDLPAIERADGSNV